MWWKVPGKCLDGLESVYMVSAMCLERVRRVSGGFLEAFWIKMEFNLNCILGLKVKAQEQTQIICKHGDLHYCHNPLPYSK